MKQKIRVGVLFGGRSAEHEVSLRSAQTVAGALDPKKYELVLIGIDRDGRWFLGDASKRLLNSTDVSEKIIKTLSAAPVALTPTGADHRLLEAQTGKQLSQLDVLFPVLHGPYGEDGTVQGLAKLANLACVGAGVLGSAVGMDKDVMKRLLREAGVPIGKFLTLSSFDQSRLTFQTAVKQLGQPIFVKPANMGSSVGVTKVTSAAKFQAALDQAFRYDRKIILEEFIAGREIECSVLGNDQPKASVPGEIKPDAAFYSYDAKYGADSKSAVIIPARLPKSAIVNIQKLAVQTFKTLECRGMARIDFFYTPTGKVIVNEINTIPGFTSISMYPKLWEASGVPLTELVEQLIKLALEDFEADAKRATSPV